MGCVKPIVDMQCKQSYVHGMAQDAQIAVRISTALLAALDELRRKEKDLPSRAEMLRRLVDRAAGRKWGLRSMGDLLPVEAELLRRKQERVFAFERAIADRNWHPDDPLKRDLEQQLAKARASVAEFVRDLERDRQ